MNQKYQRSNPQSMLTDSDVLDIRAAYANSNASVAEIADLYGIDNKTVRSIVERRSWKHVPEPKAINGGMQEVYPDGRIRSKASNDFLTMETRSNGETVVRLTTKNGKRTRTPVAYLVAKAFIAPNLRSTAAVNVIGDEGDFHFTNLQVNGKKASI